LCIPQISPRLSALISAMEHNLKMNLRSLISLNSDIHSREQALRLVTQIIIIYIIFIYGLIILFVPSFVEKF